MSPVALRVVKAPVDGYVNVSANVDVDVSVDVPNMRPCNA